MRNARMLRAVTRDCRQSTLKTKQRMRNARMLRATVVYTRTNRTYVVLPSPYWAQVEKGPAYLRLRYFAINIVHFLPGRGCHISITRCILISRIGEELDNGNRK